jgi:hypothetical protein
MKSTTRLDCAIGRVGHQADDAARLFVRRHTIMTMTGKKFRDLVVEPSRNRNACML